MKRIKILSCVTAVLLVVVSAVSAEDDPAWCGNMIKGNWRVVDAGGIGYHILKKVKVKENSNNKFDIDLEDDSTPKKTYEGKDFELSCTARPPSATLTGDVLIDSCAHTLIITYPYNDNGISNWHEVGFEYPNSHPTGTCLQHPVNVHSETMHPGTAHGSDN